jgi:hypothetical protein
MEGKAMAEGVAFEAQKEKRSDNSFIGAAGVHYAAYKLTRKGMIALPTVRNTPGTDLIVTSCDGRRHANIQVKATQHETAKFWIISSVKKFEERKRMHSEDDYFLLLRPRRSDDPGSDEFEGFLLTAAEAINEMQAHLDYWRNERGQEPKFSLCIYVDKGVREEQWHLPPDSKETWRGRWQGFDLNKSAKG